MTLLKINVLNAEPDGYSAEARGMLKAIFNLQESNFSRSELLRSLANIDVLIVRLGHRIDAELLSQSPSLKAIVTATTGLNHIDLVAAARQGVEILSLKGETEFLRRIPATAELTWGLAINLARHIPSALLDVRSDAWRRDRFVGCDLRGRSIGIIGFGRIGRMIADYAITFGMTVLAYDPSIDSSIEPNPAIKFCKFDQVLAASDFITVHVPYCVETQGLIGSREFSTMKAGAYFINTSRGEVVNEAALLVALSTRHLAGAALDVLANESMLTSLGMAAHPLISYARSHENLLITPHIGGASKDSMRMTEVFMAKKLIAFCRGL